MSIIILFKINKIMFGRAYYYEKCTGTFVGKFLGKFLGKLHMTTNGHMAEKKTTIKRVILY